MIMRVLEFWERLAAALSADATTQAYSVSRLSSGLYLRRGLR